MVIVGSVLTVYGSKKEIKTYVPVLQVFTEAIYLSEGRQFTGSFAESSH